MSIGWTVFVLLITALILRILYKRRAFRHIEYTRRFRDASVFAGEATEMIETISNRKLLPLPWARAESRMDTNLLFASDEDSTISHGLYHKSVFALMPYSRITRRHNFQALKRGLYCLDSVTLTAGDPIMMGETTKTIGLSAHLAVYPRLLSQEELPFSFHSWLGELAVRRWIIPDPFLRVGTRPYEPGDGMHLIHWKATARTGSLQVHRNDYTADPHLMIALNIDTTPELRDPIPEPERIEYALSLAATVAERAVRSGVPVGFMTNARCVGHPEEIVYLASRCSREHLVRLFHILAGVQIRRSLSLFTVLEEEVRRRPSGMDYLILSTYMTDRLSGQMHGLRSLGNSVQTVLLPEIEPVEEADHAARV